MKTKTKRTTKTTTATWFATTGNRNGSGQVALFEGIREGNAVAPTHTQDGQPFKAGGALPIGEALRPSWRPFGGIGDSCRLWVGSTKDGGSALIRPLSAALKSGDVVKATVNGVEIYVASDWSAGQKLPKYVGTKLTGANGRIENGRVSRKNGPSNVGQTWTDRKPAKPAKPVKGKATKGKAKATAKKPATKGKAKATKPTAKPTA